KQIRKLCRTFRGYAFMYQRFNSQFLEKKEPRMEFKNEQHGDFKIAHPKPNPALDRTRGKLWL
ncbi:MAG: hypothetical protein ACXAEN_19910, partial [Candidatus Thorarchaeota archaeon]